MLFSVKLLLRKIRNMLPFNNLIFVRLKYIIANYVSICS